MLLADLRDGVHVKLALLCAVDGRTPPRFPAAVSQHVILISARCLLQRRDVPGGGRRSL